MNTSSATRQSGKVDVPSTEKLRMAHDSPAVVRRHMAFGWWSLLLFLTMGLALEALHGFKAGIYLNLSNETRRLMWTLSHAHGTLLALVHLGFAFTVRLTPDWPAARRTVASIALIGASLLMPAGFFLGGLYVYSGDPGLGILLVPLGGAMLFLAALSAARALKYMGPVTDDFGKKSRK
jgi:hypothetical protein